MGKENQVDLRKMLLRLSPYNIKKGILYLKHYGFKDFFVKLTERFEKTEVDYSKWFQEHRVSEEELNLQRKEIFKNPAVISIIVPLYRTPELFLRQMIESVLDQTYSFWELCLADGSGEESQTEEIVLEYQKRDPRIKYRKLGRNLGISGNTNEALKMAQGEYTALFDHDDLLEPDALFQIARAVESDSPDVLYTDEDKVSADVKEYFQPHFKPDFSMDLLRSNNYICHFFVVKTALVKKVRGFNRDYDGAQDHDFIFRCIEASQRVVHIPRILYHWRIHKTSTADNPMSKMYAVEAGRRAVADHLQRMKVNAEVTLKKEPGFYRVKYAVEGQPFVSVIIPNKDHVDLLKKCLKSLREKTTYQNYEILVVENNSTEKETFDFYKEVDGQNKVRVVYWDREFNYSAINNFGVRKSRGDYLIFLNNDITVITPDWMEEMIGHCQRKEVGAVGARLYYPDDTIQHAGIVIGIGGIAGSMFTGMSRSRSGYFHKAALQQDLSAVTAACMMVRRSVFEKRKGFEERLAVAFNDVDLCLRIREAGYLIVYDPYIEMYHDESKTRGAEDTKEKVRRFQSEIEFMRTRWISILKNGDPYYNPNLSLKTWNYDLKK